MDERLIQSLNKVQDVFTSLGYDPIELPKIAVVGAQSAGKSSVLESLVGRSVLPRGTGIVTRCPLVLQLNHCPLNDNARRHFKLEDGGDAPEEWGEFLHAGDKKFCMDEICAEIEKQTDVLAGENRGICDTAITLKVFSPRVIDLTLVDLPGITKVPVGDQPEDIEQQIHRLIRHYIENPLCIILAVVTANTDMATNESLKLAKEFDPQGLRTLAVVTKLDLMDKGTDANDILSQRVIQVQLGIVGVVNRSQLDINENKSLESTLADERKFFETHYPSLANRMGSKYLASALHGILLNHISNCLPAVQEKIRQEIDMCERLLQTCGEVVENPKKELVDIITKFVSAYRKVLEGGSLDTSALKLVGGANICHIFNSKLKQDLSKVDPIKSYSYEHVLMKIKNASGPRPPFFVSEVAFETLVKPEIRKLLPPCISCVDLIEKEMLEVVNECFPEDVVLRFPALKKDIITVVKNTLQRYVPKTKERISDLIDVETAYISYSRLDFLKEESIMHVFDKTQSDLENCGALERQIPFKRCINPSVSSSRRSSRDVRQVQNVSSCIKEIAFQDMRQMFIIGKMLPHYFGLVSESVQDLVPKTIMWFLVEKVKDGLQSELLMHFYADEKLLSRVFQERVSVVLDRQEATEKLVALRSAMDILCELVYEN